MKPTHAGKTKETAGSRAVALLGMKYGPVNLAKKLGVTDRAIFYLIQGKRQPSPATKKRLAEVFDVALDLWRQKPKDEPAPLAEVPEAPTESVAERSTIQLLEAAVKRAEQAEFRTMNDPHTSASSRANAQQATTAAIKALSKARGDEQISMARLVKSEPWAKLRAALVEASKDCAPCLERLARVCERLDGEA